MEPATIRTIFNAAMSYRGRRYGMLILSTIAGFLLLALWHEQTIIRDFTPRISMTGSKGPTRPLTFYEIAKKYGTDKVDPHHYERMYAEKFEPIRNHKVKMLEIGLGCDQTYGPGASYYTWLAYFPHVDLYFIEYDAKCAKAWSNRTKDAHIFIGDQADPIFLEEVVYESGGDFDIIIDDGGHTMIQQRTSLGVLWDAVKPGGMYFVEDLLTSYSARYGGGNRKKGTFMETMKGLLDDLNKFGRGVGMGGEVLRVEFTQECVGITKKTGREVEDVEGVHV